MSVLLASLCSLSVVPFADQLDDDLIVDVVNNGGLAIKARTHNNMAATPPEYAMLNYLIGRLPIVGVEPKVGDTYYVRQSVILPDEPSVNTQQSVGPDCEATAAEADGEVQKLARGQIAPIEYYDEAPFIPVDSEEVIDDTKKSSSKSSLKTLQSRLGAMISIEDDTPVQATDVAEVIHVPV